MRVNDLLVELLAIKLYEHDAQTGLWPPSVTSSWARLGDEDRDIYRAIARGEMDYGMDQTDA